MRLTLNELRTCGQPVVRPQDVAPILGMHPQYINLMAKRDELPFRFIRSGNRTKIIRKSVLEFLGETDLSDNKKSADVAASTDRREVCKNEQTS